MSQAATTADSLAQKPCHSAHRKRLILKSRFSQIPLPEISCLWATVATNLSDHPKPAIHDHLKTGHMETLSRTLTAA
jgi:hypothetical protein